jgi:hypothetical protein
MTLSQDSGWMGRPKAYTLPSSEPTYTTLFATAIYERTPGPRPASIVA